jgi:hypothetical protein
LGKFQMCCTIWSASSYFNQNLSNLKGRHGGPAMGVKDSLRGVWSEVTFGRSVRTGTKFARGLLFQWCERNALSSLESVGCGRPFEYVKFCPISGTSMRRSSYMMSLKSSILRQRSWGSRCFIVGSDEVEVTHYYPRQIVECSDLSQFLI